MPNKLFLFILSILFVSPLMLCLFAALILRCGRNFTVGAYLRWKYGRRVEFLSSNDANLASDSDENPLHCNSYFIIEGKVNISAIRERVKSKIMRKKNPDGTFTFPKLRQRLCCELGYFFWFPEDKFRLKNHIFQFEDIELKNNEELLDFLSDFFNRPLPRDLSPWFMALTNLSDNFPGLEPGFHHVMSMSCHHAMCDAISFMRMCNSYLFDQKGDLVTPNRKVTVIGRLRLFARILAFGTGALIYDYFSPGDDNIVTNYGGSTKIKTYGFSDFLLLDRVKKVKNVTNTTVNDVLLSCLSGGIRSLFLREGESPKSCTHVVPVSMQSTSAPPKLQNYMSVMIFRDSANKSTVGERLQSTKKNMDAAKNSEAIYMYYLLHSTVFNIFPRCFGDLVMSKFKLTSVVSNVKGPATACYIFGGEVVQMGFFVSTINNIGLGMSVMSYNGKVQFGVKASAVVVQNKNIIQRLLEDIISEFNELEKLVV